MHLEQITAHFDPDEGWQDIFLSIVAVREMDDIFEFVGKGLFGSDIVGLKVEVYNNMAAGLLEDGEINSEAFYRGGLRLVSLGEESNRLLWALGSLYGVKAIGAFKEVIDQSVVFSLNQTAPNFAETGYYKFKLFFRDDSEIDYCEMFCNIDTVRGIIELHEKDEDYRMNIIKAFSSANEDIR